MPDEGEGEDQRERRPGHYNPAAGPGNVVHWITHARRRGWGMWAWVLHRVTAVILVVGTLIHVLANHFGYAFPFGTLLTDDLVVFSGVYHALNGLRVLAIELSPWAARNEDRLFWAVVLSTVGFLIYWAWVIGL